MVVWSWWVGLNECGSMCVAVVVGSRCIPQQARLMQEEGGRVCTHRGGEAGGAGLLLRDRGEGGRAGDAAAGGGRGCGCWGGGWGVGSSVCELARAQTIHHPSSIASAAASFHPLLYHHTHGPFHAPKARVGAAAAAGRRTTAAVEARAARCIRWMEWSLGVVWLLGPVVVVACEVWDVRFQFFSPSSPELENRRKGALEQSLREASGAAQSQSRPTTAASISDGWDAPEAFLFWLGLTHRSV